jgi:tetratricopeptide (TPR) repeat protein
MAKDEQSYLRSANDAATLFARNNRQIRAAAIWERLGKHCAMNGTFEQALGYYRRAQEAFLSEDDGRGVTLTGEICNLLACCGRWEEAADGFIREGERIYASDPILVNQAQRLLLFATVAIATFAINADDLVGGWRRVQQHGLVEDKDRHYWFANSREGQWAQSLWNLLLEDDAKNVGDPEQRIDALDKQLAIMASMPSWFLSAWNRLKDHITSRPMDLT